MRTSMEVIPGNLAHTHIFYMHLLPPKQKIIKKKEKEKHTLCWVEFVEDAWEGESGLSSMMDD